MEGTEMGSGGKRVKGGDRKPRLVVRRHTGGGKPVVEGNEEYTPLKTATRTVRDGKNVTVLETGVGKGTKKEVVQGHNLPGRDHCFDEMPGDRVLAGSDFKKGSKKVGK